MNLTRMMTDKVFFEDKHGTRRGPYKTRFGTDRITVFQDELNVAEGDRVIQPLRDGTEQVYIADAVAFGAARRNVPAHYSITIVKADASSTTHTPGSTAVPGAQGAEAGTSNKNHENMAFLIQSLTEAIENTGFPTEQKDEARRLLHMLVEHPVVLAVLNARD